jgi:hypothetical protein
MLGGQRSPLISAPVKSADVTFVTALVMGAASTFLAITVARLVRRLPAHG